uniref:AAA-ATPase-like domain-containing protein n=1 Tax=Graphocephala atropunctata TaxID=36148 RepID=A0A1B6MTP4_9HEMI
MSDVKNILGLLTAIIICIKKVSPTSGFDFESSEFSKIANTPAFVDKTLFIKAIIENNETSLITAPPGFGKSTNMNMLKTFLEIEVDDNGAPKTQVDYFKHQVKDTRNYRLFYDNVLKIAEDTKIMQDLGRTPVLSVSFKCNRNITSFDDALEFIKEVVHNCYKQYRYLERSDKLGVDQKQYIETWCDDKNYHMFGKHRIATGLRELSEFLYRHFNDRTVFVLIDDHDSVFKRAMFHVTDDDQLDDIVRLTVSLMNSLLKRNGKHVHGGLVAGVSDIPVFGSSLSEKGSSDAFIKYRFLDDHPFVDFFGLLKDEVDGLFVYPELKLGENVVNKAKAMYGGYKSKKGTEVFNLYSILNFLKTGEVKNFWKSFNSIPNLNEVIEVSAILKGMEKMVTGEPINIQVLNKLTVDDIVDLRNLQTDPQSQAVAVAIKYFSFLLEEGYLTYAFTQEDTENQINENSAVKIPNNEIKEIFIQALT